MLVMVVDQSYHEDEFGDGQSGKDKLLGGIDDRSLETKPGIK